MDANKQYIDVNGTAKVLIGMSSEYLPHITRTSHNADYCTFANYTTCIDTLASYGLIQAAGLGDDGEQRRSERSQPGGR